jgi:hypothetical protein
VRLARVVEDALGRGRLPGIDVGHDADVTIVLERCGSWHSSLCGSGSAGRPASNAKVCRSPAKTRLDLAFLEAGTGIHPPSPGALATAARGGPMARRDECPGVELSCVAFRDESSRAAVSRHRSPPRNPRTHREPTRSSSAFTTPPDRQALRAVQFGSPATGSQCRGCGTHPGPGPPFSRLPATAAPTAPLGAWHHPRQWTPGLAG